MANIEGTQDLAGEVLAGVDRDVMVLVAERPQAFDAQAAAAEIVSRLALLGGYLHSLINEGLEGRGEVGRRLGLEVHGHVMQSFQRGSHPRRTEEHQAELQSRMRISAAV